MWLPESASTFGPPVDRIFWAIVAVTGFFYFLVQGLLLLFVFRYKARPGQKASYTHGSTWVEVVWTVIPALILLALTVASQQAWVKIRSPQIPPDALSAELLAEQFAWNIRYPGPDGQYGTPDDISTINQLHLPLERPTLLHIRSKDVIHSFFVAEFRGKQDAVPGLHATMLLQPTRAGEFELRCAELCGLGHYRMRGMVTTEPMQNFQAWLAETKANE